MPWFSFQARPYITFFIFSLRRGVSLDMPFHFCLEGTMNKKVRCVCFAKDFSATLRFARNDERWEVLECGAGRLDSSASLRMTRWEVRVKSEELRVEIRWRLFASQKISRRTEGVSLTTLLHTRGKGVGYAYARNNERWEVLECGAGRLDSSASSEWQGEFRVKSWDKVKIVCFAKDFSTSAMPTLEMTRGEKF
jgi:hypothetical protein